jgi:hypothetical protein
VRKQLHALFASIVALPACNATSLLPKLEPPADAKSMLMVIDSGDRRLTRGWDLTPGEEPPIMFSATVGSRLHVFYSPATLAQLDLGTMIGPVGSHDETFLARELSSGYASVVSATVANGWTKSTEPTRDGTPYIDTIRLEHCMSIGGCFAQVEGGLFACSPACAAAPVDPPHPPAAPAPPNMGPCAPGWSAQRDLDAVVCTPPRRVDRCGAGDMQRLGVPSCAPVDVCPSAGVWPRDPQGAPILYVDAAAPLGGDGSKARPFSTIALALLRARDGAAIVLALGTHTSTAEIDLSAQTLTIAGACASGASLDVPRLRVRGTAVIQDLTLSGPLEVAGASASARLVASAVTGAPEPSIEVRDGGRLSTSSVSVGGDASCGAIRVESGASAALEDTVLTGTCSGDVLSVSSGAITARDLVLAANAPHALHVEAGASADLTRVLAERFTDVGLVFEGSSTIAARDLVIRRTNIPSVAPGSAAPDLPAVRITASASAAVTRAVIDDALDGFVVDTGNAAITDVVIRRSNPAIRDLGYGLHALDGTARLVRVLVDGASQFGVWTSGQASLTADDLAISNLRDYVDAGQATRSAEGVVILDRSSAVSRRVAVRCYALASFNTSSSRAVRLCESALAGTPGRCSASARFEDLVADADCGSGEQSSESIRLQDASTLALERAQLLRADAGLVVLDTAAVDGVDLEIATGTIGLNLTAPQIASTIDCMTAPKSTMTRAWIHDVLLGICTHCGTTLEAEEFDLGPSKDGNVKCNSGTQYIRANMGAYLYNGAVLDLDHFRVHGHLNVGIASSGHVALRAMNGVLDGNNIAIQASSYLQLYPYLDRVKFLDNVVDIQPFNTGTH